MAYVVTDACVKCKYTDCVEVCPVDCFHEGEDMLVINPDTCIDCGVCEQECPVNAIQAESTDLIVWLERAKIFITEDKWPPITEPKLPLPNAEKYKHTKDKFKKYCMKRPSA